MKGTTHYFLCSGILYATIYILSKNLIKEPNLFFFLKGLYLKTPQRNKDGIIFPFLTSIQNPHLA